MSIPPTNITPSATVEELNELMSQMALGRQALMARLEAERRAVMRMRALSQQLREYPPRTPDQLLTRRYATLIRTELPRFLAERQVCIYKNLAERSSRTN